jgi:hypothetical protein
MDSSQRRQLSLPELMLPGGSSHESLPRRHQNEKGSRRSLPREKAVGERWVAAGNDEPRAMAEIARRWDDMGMDGVSWVYKWKRGRTASASAAFIGSGTTKWGVGEERRRRLAVELHQCLRFWGREGDRVVYPFQGGKRGGGWLGFGALERHGRAAPGGTGLRGPKGQLKLGCRGEKNGIGLLYRTRPKGLSGWNKSWATELIFWILIKALEFKSKRFKYFQIKFELDSK